MATTTLQRNFQNFKNRDKPFVIEMNEAPVEGVAFQQPPPPLQPMEVSYIQTQAQGQSPLKASVLSLNSTSCIENSDIQPLTEVHACQYDECLKYQSAKTDKEAENPSSLLKNVSLYLVIILFVLWVIIYTTLTQFKVF